MIYIFAGIAVIVGVLCWRHFFWQALPWPVTSFELPSYQVHRGYWTEGERENTLKAFIEAQKQGYQMCELDVHLTSDNEVVVFHDESLHRMAGVVGTISEMTYDRIKSVYPAPTLKEILLSHEVTPYFNIELKTRQKWSGALEQAVVQVVKETKSTNRVLFSSFNPLSLWRLKLLLPQVPRALLATKEDNSLNGFLLRNRCLAPYIGIHLLRLDYRDITPMQVTTYKRRGVPVALWTVNDSELAKLYLKSGAVSIITDSVKKEKA